MSKPTSTLDGQAASTELKQCVSCFELKPISEYSRRSGRRAGANARRGICKQCRAAAARLPADADAGASGDPAGEAPESGSGSAGRAEAAAPGGKRGRRRRGLPAAAPEAALAEAAELAPPPEEQPRPARKRRRRGGGQAAAAAQALPAATQPAARPPRSAGPQPAARPAGAAEPQRPQARGSARPRATAPGAARGIDPHDASLLRATREGFVRMRGRTDKGRGWYQEIDLEMAVTLVKERAAVVVNRHTIRRLLSNRDFRLMILNRDKYTCYFCGQYGDTIDHLLPRSKGGHTTPDNCVCACNLCNQTKANRDLDEFVAAGIPVKTQE